MLYILGRPCLSTNVSSQLKHAFGVPILMQKPTCIRVVGAAVALAVVVACLFLAALRGSTPLRGLNRRDVVEIRMCEWRMAWHDILSGFSGQDLRAAPRKLW